MKWEIKVTTPKDNAHKAARAFSYQALPFKRHYKKEFGKHEKYEWFKLYYEGNHKQYLRISALVTKFNIDMQKITEGIVFKRGSRKWKPGYREWAIKTFYTNPASITITEEPSVEDYQAKEKSLKEKFKEKIGWGKKTGDD